MLLVIAVAIVDDCFCLLSSERLEQRRWRSGPHTCCTRSTSDSPHQDTCALHVASIPMEECTKHIGVPVCIAGPILDVCIDGVKVEGEDMLAWREAQWQQEHRRGCAYC